MFARVITAQAGTEGFDGAIRLAEQQLPGARQMPGFTGYYLLTATGLTALYLDTYEVAVSG